MAGGQPSLSKHWKKHWKRKIEPEDVHLIRALRDEGLRVQEIADKFELSKSHVSKIVNMKSWEHVI
jgi:hypothetical protein